MSKTTNHYGKWVDSETPITGVISNNDISQFIGDESYNAIDLDFEDYCHELKKQYHPNSNAYKEAIESYESESPTLLIGDWKKDRKGLYYPDKKGEYAAIVRYDVTQVVYSKYTTRANLCSPCYPGQADVNPDNQSGEFLCYTLPPSAFETY